MASTPVDAQPRGRLARVLIAMFDRRYDEANLHQTGTERSSVGELELVELGGRTRTSNFQNRTVDALSVAPTTTRT